MSIAGSLGLLLLLVTLAVIPGPSDLLVAGSALRRGYRSAVDVTLGILLADLIFILAVVYGASLASDYSIRYQECLSWISAGVLTGLGVWMLCVKVGRPEMESEQSIKREFSFAAGFAITFLDPKALAFYLGVLPAFFDIENFTVMDILVLLLLVSVVICITKAFYVWVAVTGMRLLPSAKAQSILLKMTGVALIFIGAYRILL
ncbi:LysE family transporter [Coraliomargarita sp. SDUM461004]|uniref:LysE family transporter n=1 Tax=Thalassobacterium sedimentorum TaxID=3041258 RepID=A0ABU1ALZ2_9BACT|nr:LysE family transporter [Coraliomargarita sp. SDUM461004]MDQ8194618.1 LysE family transporter [Coraliomargarita sp. SDUM461004]